MTLYDKLEVSEKASGEVIEKAYKTLAKKYHPDVQRTPQEVKEAEERMKEINEAYSILKDDAKRSEYDSKLQRERENEAVRRENQASSQTTSQVNNQNVRRDIYGYGDYSRPQQRTQNQQYQTSNQNYQNWQQNLANLSPKEREKLKKKIERDAREEYTRVAEEYYRQQGYRVIHKTTLREHVTRLIVILVILLFCILLWIIPFTHDWLVSIYESNGAIKILVDVVINFFNAIFNGRIN